MSEQDGRESEIERVQKERELGNLPFAVAFSPRVAYRPQNDRRRGKIQTFFPRKESETKIFFRFSDQISSGAIHRKLFRAISDLLSKI